MVGRVAVIGAGTWGTVVASMVARRVPTVLWARRPEVADDVNHRHRNPAYLADFALPAELRATTALGEALSGAELVVMGVPSHGFRDVLVAARPFVAPGIPVLSLTKGLEVGTGRRMTEVVDEVLPGHPVGVLSGPNLAREIVAGHPTATVIAFEDEPVCADLQHLFGTEVFRVYTNPDVVGCEVAGALKNVMAIACGISDGMGFGDNTRAALITRGLAELSRLGVALGGRLVTFSGLAGMGDLVATCISPQSRNRHVGQELGRGRTLEQIVAGTTTVAEGVRTSKAVVELGARHGVDTPIAEQVVAVLYGGKTALDIIPALLRRVARSEQLDGLPLSWQ